jgi:hypothetical protein
MADNSAIYPTNLFLYPINIFHRKSLTVIDIVPMLVQCTLLLKNPLYFSYLLEKDVIEVTGELRSNSFKNSYKRRD